MKYIYPDYAEEFRCIASRCKHSCCIGWEIDIDPDTLSFWQKPELNTRLDILSTVSCVETPHFVLTEGERCPHLREDGLCRMILAYGEECLCDICREHPRFYNEVNDREEMGLGMCCEEAARLLLRGTGPVCYIQEEEEPEEGEAEEVNPSGYELSHEEESSQKADDERETELDEGYRDVFESETASLLNLRSSVTALLYQKDRTIYQRLEQAAALLGGNLPSVMLAEVIDEYCRFEVLDPKWTGLLRNLKQSCSETSLRELPDEISTSRMIDYFLYRYFAAEGQIPIAVFLFACFSALIICSLEKVDDSGLEEHLRMYSSEIEYSDCNLDAAMDYFLRFS